jgi:hypothetical protein
MTASADPEGAFTLAYDAARKTAPTRSSKLGGPSGGVSICRLGSAADLLWLRAFPSGSRSTGVSFSRWLTAVRRRGEERAKQPRESTGFAGSHARTSPRFFAMIGWV